MKTKSKILCLVLRNHKIFFSSKVNVTMNICSTRDTDKVMALEMIEEEDEETAAAEPRHKGHDHNEEDHEHKMYAPREDAEWEFKTGTCVFRLQ